MARKSKRVDYPLYALGTGEEVGFPFMEGFGEGSFRLFPWVYKVPKVTFSSLWAKDRELCPIVHDLALLHFRKLCVSPPVVCGEDWAHHFRR